MAKKTLDPNAVAALLAKGKQEATHVARVEEVPAKTSPRLKEVSPPQAQPAPKKLEKRYVTLFIDRKSTRLHSSHLVISYAVFCLKRRIMPHKSDTTYGFGSALMTKTAARRLH